MACVIYQERQSVEDRLSDLGLKAHIIRTAVSLGEIARASCTPNHPQNAAGWYAWAETVRYLREGLAADGWTRESVNGVSLVVSPDGRVAIVVSTGDEATGMNDNTPRTKSTKGKQTALLIAQNRQQLLLEFADLEEPDATAPLDARTWYLLFCSDGDEVRIELSFPKSLDINGRPSDWAERIIIEPFQRDDRLPHVTREDEGPDIDFEVTRLVS